MPTKVRCHCEAHTECGRIVRVTAEPCVATKNRWYIRLGSLMPDNGFLRKIEASARIITKAYRDHNGRLVVETIPGKGRNKQATREVAQAVADVARQHRFA